MRINHLFLAAMLVPGATVEAQPVPAIQRSLPAANRNSESGQASRANIRWTWYEEGFVGDDMTVGQPGERWVLERVTVWTVPGGKDAGDPDFLGDLYRDVRLYFGSENDGLSPVSVGGLEPGSNQPSNPLIRIREARDPSGLVYYDEFGAQLRVWEVEFSGLNLTVEGGRSYLFGAFGLGRPIPGEAQHIYPWFNHASNARLSDVPAPGSDGRLRLFRGSGQTGDVFVSTGNGWDKDCDINVEVVARKLESAQ